MASAFTVLKAVARIGSQLAVDCWTATVAAVAAAHSDKKTSPLKLKGSIFVEIRTNMEIGVVSL